MKSVLDLTFVEFQFHGGDAAGGVAAPAAAATLHFTQILDAGILANAEALQEALSTRSWELSKRSARSAAPAGCNQHRGWGGKIPSQRSCMELEFQTFFRRFPKFLTNSPEFPPYSLKSHREIGAGSQICEISVS